MFSVSLSESLPETPKPISDAGRDPDSETDSGYFHANGCASRA
jgi:hypothetical protein